MTDLKKNFKRKSAVEGKGNREMRKKGFLGRGEEKASKGRCAPSKRRLDSEDKEHGNL